MDQISSTRAGSAADKFQAPLKSLITLVPAYNEEGRICETLAALRGMDQRLATLGIEQTIIVINDGSTDDTHRVAVDCQADYVVSHNRNQGLGAAVRTGLRFAREKDADFVVKFDADLQHDPEDIPKMLAPLTEHGANVVYGFRFDKIEYRMPVVRRLGNRFFSGLMRLLTGWDIKDGQPGIFAVDRVYLSEFLIPGNYNYTQQILLDASHRDLRFQHVPVRFRKRTTGKSFVSLKYPFKVTLQILLVLVCFRPLYVFGMIGLGFLGLASAVFGIEMLQWLTGSSPKPVQHVNLVLGSAVFGLNILFLGLIGELISIGQRYRR